MLTKKKLLVIAPIVPQHSDIEPFAQTLSFLTHDFHLEFIDPLTHMEQVTNELYYSLWQEELRRQSTLYDGFIGFSFGGVILQQCFSSFSTLNKPIILFSTPTFADNILTQRLGKVIDLSKKNKLQEALIHLYNDVFYPYESTFKFNECLNNPMTANRLIFGLTRVLETDATKILSTIPINYTHLIGEKSHLVNKANVIAGIKGHLCIVPEAGMRVLENNFSYCQAVILEALKQ
jgi:hypothetical protein